MDASGRDLHRRYGRVEVVASRSERSDDGGEGRDLEHEGDDGQEEREPALPVRVADEPDDVEDAGERQESRKESKRVVGRLKSLCDDSEAAQGVWMQGRDGGQRGGSQVSQSRGSDGQEDRQVCHPASNRSDQQFSAHRASERD